MVEDSVNKVGVDLNTASAPLLEHISGINKQLAKNIVAYREANGRFVLYHTESVIYAAKLEQLAIDYGVTDQEVIQNFRLIHQEWKTGETE